LHIIQALMQKVDHLAIAMVTDENEQMKEPDELDLFYQTTETFHTIQQVANDIDVPIAESISLQVKENERSEAFIHLEEHFDDRPAPSFAGEWKQDIGLYEAIHPRAEVDGVVQEILQLVRDKEYRYKDMVIYVRDTAIYH